MGQHGDIPPGVDDDNPPGVDGDTPLVVDDGTPLVLGGGTQSVDVGAVCDILWIRGDALAEVDSESGYSWYDLEGILQFWSRFLPSSPDQSPAGDHRQVEVRCNADSFGAGGHG